MSRPRILLIDDDRENLALLAETLGGRYAVEAHADPRAGLAAAAAQPPAAALVDLDMPGTNGIEVCEALKRDPGTAQAVVIILTSDAQAASMQRALRAGADDYVTKPFRAGELLNRLEFRLGQTRTDGPLRCGNLMLDVAMATALVGSGAGRRRLTLTPLAARVLEALARNEGRVVSREQLLDQAWGGEEESSDRAVDLHVFRLRRQLAGWNHEIRAVYGRGYTVVRARSGGRRSR
jgi:DNA-binding response OmpR family regulator